MTERVIHQTCRLLLVSGLLAIVAIAGAGVSRAWINHDAGWYLYAARAWLNGAVLYRDVVDPNPPLVVFLMTMPVWIAEAFRTPLPATFKSVIFAAALASATVTGLILRRTALSSNSRLLLTATVAFLLLPLAGGDFGQREHIASILAVPYVVALVAATSGGPLGTRREGALGVLAGVGFALKPHFLLPWLAAEVCTAAMTHVRLRPGARGVLASLMLYAIGIPLLAPQFLVVAPQAATVYGGLNSDGAMLLRLADLRIWTLALVALLFVPVPSSFRKASLLVFTVATGFLLAAVLQWKGWGYHLYPFRVFVGVFAVFLAAAFAERHGDTGPNRLWIRHGVAVLVIVGLVLVSWRDRRKLFAPSGVEQVAALHALVSNRHAESLAVLSMRTIVSPAFPVVNYTGAEWTMRHNSLWPLPGLYGEQLRKHPGAIASFRTIDEMTDLERNYFDNVVDDLCARPPRLLLVEAPVPPDGRGYGSFDLLAYYGQDERFARLTGAYAADGAFGPFRVFERRHATSCGGIAVHPTTRR